MKVKVAISSSEFYREIGKSLSPEERIFIINHLSNKSCLNCTNQSCRVEYYDKLGLDEFGKPQGSECLGWNNHEIIGKSKVLGKF